MNYDSIASIYAANEAVRGKLFARLENLNAAQQTFRPAEGAWSIVEIMEHLSITEKNMVQLFGLLLAKTESAAAAANASAPPAFQPFSMDALIEKVQDKKFTAPEQVRPSGQATLVDSLAALRETRARIESLRPRLEAVDLTAAAYPHPFWGDLNLAQWLAFIGLHEGRHLAQVKRVMDTPGFGGANAS